MTDPSLLTSWRETSRFKNLLNPIRDPSAAWGVDVAEHLVEYAQSIGIDLSSEFDAQQHQLTPQRNKQKSRLPSDDSPPPSSPSSPESVDFAQAALILQGSTSIYSRKIESLYTLAFAAVSTINQLSNGQDGPGRKDKGRNQRNGDNDDDNNDSNDNNDDDSDNDATFNPDQIQFLLLDDDDDDDQQNDLRKQQITKQTITGNDEGDATRNKTHNNDIEGDDGEDQDATRLRPVPHMLMQNVSISDGNMDRANFKLRAALTHPSGVFLTDGCPLVDENLNMEPTRLTPSRRSAYVGSVEVSPSNRHDAPLGQAPNIEPPIMDDDGDQDMGSYDEIGDDPPIISQTMESSAGALRQASTGDANAVASADVVLDPQAHPEPETEPEPEPMDPFEMYDQHEEVPKLIKPVKIGLSRRPRDLTRCRASALYVPPPANGSNTAGRSPNTAAASKRAANSICDSSSDVCDMIDAAIGRIPKTATLTSYVCVPAARDSVQMLTRRRRKNNRRARQEGPSRIGVQVADDGSGLNPDTQREGDELFAARIHARRVQEDDFSFPEYDGDLNLDDGDRLDSSCGNGSLDPEEDVQVTRGSTLHGSADSGLDEPFLLQMGNGGNLVPGGAGVGGPAGDETLSGLDHAFMDDSGYVGGGGLGHGQDAMMMMDSNQPHNQLSALASSYTETCAKYLAETAWMWEKRVVDYRLAERVEEWTARIQPVLEREEERDEFNIRTSGLAIIARLKELNLSDGGRMSNVISAPQKFEVCRSFLASLQLANQGNVCIVRDPSEEGTVCDPVLRLGGGGSGPTEEEETTGDEQHLEEPVFVTPSGGGERGKKTRRKRPRSPTSSGATTRPSLRSRMNDSESQ